MNFLEARVASENGKVVLIGKGFRLALPLDKTQNLPDEVTVSIRPEDLDGPVPNGENTMTMQLEVTEPLGNELLACANCSGKRVVANLDPHRQVAVNSRSTWKSIRRPFTCSIEKESRRFFKQHILGR